MTNEIVKYQAGEVTVELSPETVRKYLVSGQGKVTDQEIMMFLKLCEYQKLNPFLREAYLIKYGSDAATIVTGKDTFLKRAYRHPKYRGHKTGVSDDGQTAWAEVYVAKYTVPIRCEVDYKEYVGRKKDGTINRIWASKPNTMLKKVALVQALREAFPETFGGMYSQEEIGSIDTPLPTEIVDTQVVKNGDNNGSGIEMDPLEKWDIKCDEAGTAAKSADEMMLWWKTNSPTIKKELSKADAATIYEKANAYNKNLSMPEKEPGSDG